MDTSPMRRYFRNFNQKIHEKPQNEKYTDVCLLCALIFGATINIHYYCYYVRSSDSATHSKLISSPSSRVY
jgi:hypothetical protein